MMPIPKKVRRFFDINDKNDVQCFKKYYTSGAWGPTGCPFEVEEPWVSIPDMIKHKLLCQHLKIKE